MASSVLEKNVPKTPVDGLSQPPERRMSLGQFVNRCFKNYPDCFKELESFFGGCDAPKAVSFLQQFLTQMDQRKLSLHVGGDVMETLRPFLAADAANQSTISLRDLMVNFNQRF
jgi:hypothetical protein